MGEPKLLQAKELFHVKLAAILKKRGLGAIEVARLIPGLNASSVSRWSNENAGKDHIPAGIYMCWLLMALNVTPEELVGPLPGPKRGSLQRKRGQGGRSGVPEGSDARWLLEGLEGLVGDFRRHLANQAAAGMEGAAELDAAAKKDAG